MIAYLETDAEGEGQRDDHDGPGEGGQQPAAYADPNVAVMGCNKKNL